MISKRIKELLKTREFISVATCDFNGQPNAAPKLLLKFEDNYLFLVDYIINRTWQNLKINPRASLSFMDTETLTGYQINGPVEIIDSGEEYDRILNELRQKQIDLSTKRIIEGVTQGKVHENYEVAITDKFVVFKVKVNEFVEIGSSGEVKRQKICQS